MRSAALYLTVLLWVCVQVACQIQLPERVSQYTIGYEEKKLGDTLIVTFNNPLYTPLSVTLLSDIPELSAPFEQTGAFRLAARSDTALQFVFTGIAWETDDVRYHTAFDADFAEQDSIVVALPFPVGDEYEIMQGYAGTFSHTSDYSRYAIDFGMGIGDTVTAAWNGRVVGVIQSYEKGSGNRKLRDYANFVTVYHPGYGIYTQYVHLMHNGALVELGDSVQIGQPIALSGNTGFTTSPHLHFNVLASFPDKFKSLPVYFTEGYHGSHLQEGMSALRQIR